MRILAGSLKNKAITARLPGVGRGEIKFRPTTSKTREAIFNILQNNAEVQEFTGFPECQVLDVFAGSGIFSWEAISRGAQSAVLIETDVQHAKLLQLNAEFLEVEDQATIMRCDVRRVPPAIKPFSVVFMDPPYREPRLIQEALAALSNKGWLADNCVVIIETALRNDLRLAKEYTLYTEKRYGNTKVIIYFYNAKSHS